jgi:hypothetical protein
VSAVVDRYLDLDPVSSASEAIDADDAAVTCISSPSRRMIAEWRELACVRARGGRGERGSLDVPRREVGI